MANTSLEFSGLKKLGTHGIIVNEELVGVPDMSLYVSDESELASLPEDLPAGTIAIQYGFVNMWQLNDSGDWISMLPDPEGD